MRFWINKAVKIYLRQRFKRIQYFMDHPHDAQEKVFSKLIEAGRYTKWGKAHDYNNIKTQTQFQQKLKINTYEDHKPFIHRMMKGEKDVLWNGQVKWFAKSSGTTNDKSKYIPVSRDNLYHCHIRGTWDSVSLLYEHKPDLQLFADKSLLSAGSLGPWAEFPQTMVGDVSAIMLHHMPTIGRPFSTPDFETALMSDWDQKIERIAQKVSKEENVAMFGGVPTWLLVMFKRILEITGKSNMLEVWPKIATYMHGGVGFSPYESQFKKLFPTDNLIYQEIYNATEGFFSVQDKFNGEKDMLLMLDNSMYFEFVPSGEWFKEYPKAISLDQVEVGQNYAIVVSTNAGLWRYMPGDTVMFTSTRPYRIRVTGRTKQFINAFGEEVMIADTDKAIADVCKNTGAIVNEYTIAPMYFNDAVKGGHQWLIEFEKEPQDLNHFATQLDKNLQHINSDYEAKRFKDIALQQLNLIRLPKGTFFQWMRSKGKLGGQFKVPRLSNHRTIIDDILQFIHKENKEVDVF